MNQETEGLKPLLSKALVAAIAETQDVHADSDNPFHKSRYASLSAHLKALKPIFAKHGLAIIQLPIGTGDEVGIKTTVLHTSGESIESVCLLHAKDLNGQQAGSLFSYLRRYALAAVAGVATDDDDAESDRSHRSVAVHQPQQSQVSTTKWIPGPAAPQPTSGGPSPIVPFGKHKGKPISQVAQEDKGYVEWLANDGEKGWTPKPYNGRISANDIALKSAAKAALGGSTENHSQSESSDDVPF